MALTFTPKTEEEISESNLWPEGEYPFQIIDYVTFGTKTLETKDTVSKGGNPMIQLVVQVYDPEGDSRIVIDYLVASVEYKIRHACVACSILDKYESGTLNAFDFIGKQGYLKLGIAKAKDEYPARNQIKDYLRPAENASPVVDTVQAPKSGLDDDDIPF